MSLSAWIARTARNYAYLSRGAFDACLTVAVKIHNGKGMVPALDREQAWKDYTSQRHAPKNKK